MSKRKNNLSYYFYNFWKGMMEVIRIIKLCFCILFCFLVSFLPFTQMDNSQIIISNIEEKNKENESSKNDVKTEEVKKIEEINEENNVIPLFELIEDNGKAVDAYGELKKEEYADSIDKLENTLKAYNKNISIACYSVDNKKALTYNLEQSYFSACTIKAGYVYYCCRKMENENIDKNLLLTYQSKHYRSGSGKIKNSPYGSEYTLETLMNQCLSISDNVAYKMLVDYFGYEEYNQMMTDIGCNSLVLNNILWGHNIKALDLAIIWNEIYNYFQMETEMSNILKTACTNTPFSYATTKLGDVEYSHKSGNNYGTFAAYNDAGIIWKGDSSYIFVVLTNSEGETRDKQVIRDAMDIIHKELFS